MREVAAGSSDEALGQWLMAAPWGSIAADLASALGEPFVARSRRSVGGGCINESWILEDGERRVFVKLNSLDSQEMFAAEADGLRELATSQAFRVPEVIAVGVTEQYAWIGLEYLEMGGLGPEGQAAFGRSLARLHRCNVKRFGWHRDNTIGSTLQRNSWNDDWVEFLRNERLGYQFELATRKGRVFEGSAVLLARLGDFFENYSPQPALVHGDLWSGNVGLLKGSEPVLFDPAVYYGDREAEFGIIEMFGGFSREFYQAYESDYPFEPGFAVRKDLYLLYHQLNHFNLFGASYAESAQGSIHRLLAR